MTNRQKRLHIKWTAIVNDTNFNVVLLLRHNTVIIIAGVVVVVTFPFYQPENFALVNVCWLAFLATSASHSMQRHRPLSHIIYQSLFLNGFLIAVLYLLMFIICIEFAIKMPCVLLVASTSGSIMTVHNANQPEHSPPPSNASSFRNLLFFH